MKSGLRSVPACFLLGRFQNECRRLMPDDLRLKIPLSLFYEDQCSSQRLLPYHLYSSLCVLKRTYRLVRHYPVIRKPVFQNKCRNTKLIEFPGNVTSLPVDYKNVISSSRTNYYRSPFAFSAGGRKTVNVGIETL